MFYCLVLLSLSPLYALIGRLLLDDRGREVVTLRQQVSILHGDMLSQPKVGGARNAFTA
jgi:hypothetical protein